MLRNPENMPLPLNKRPNSTRAAITAKTIKISRSIEKFPFFPISASEQTRNFIKKQAYFDYDCLPEQ